MRPKEFFRFPTDFDQGRKYALFHNNRILLNISKRNQSFGFCNRISFNFGLKAGFEMSEGRLNVSDFSEKQIISYNKGVVLVNLSSIR